MKILMTGGTGFIGQKFIATYSDYEYTVLSRNVTSARRTLPQDNVTLIESWSDLKDFNDFDVIINLAGEPIVDKRWSDTQKKRIQDSRWRTTREIVQRIQESIWTAEIPFSHVW